MQGFYAYGPRSGVAGAGVAAGVDGLGRVSGGEFGAMNGLDLPETKTEASPVTWPGLGLELGEGAVGGAGPAFALGRAELAPDATGSATVSAVSAISGAVGATGRRPASAAATGSPPRQLSHSAGRPYTPLPHSLAHPHPHSFPRSLPPRSSASSAALPGDPDGLHVMEQIETQATDLRYLAQGPVPLSDTASAYETPQPHASPGSASVGDNSAPPTVAGSNMHHTHNHHDAGVGGVGESTNPNKRKSVDDGGAGAKQTRSKRNRVRTGPTPNALGATVGRTQPGHFPLLTYSALGSRHQYISIACNECKRRKIKCNGETPCQRCGNLNLACLYAPNCCSSNFKDSDDFKQVTTQLSRLQDEVSWLNQTVKALQAEPSRTSSAQVPDRVPPPVSLSHGLASIQQAPTRSGPFRGPTSMAFSLDVANATISNMGYRGLSDSDEQSQQTSIDAGPLLGDRTGLADPLFDFDKDEMVRLCRLHEEEVGIMYPVLDIQVVISHAKSLSSVIDSLQGQRPMEPFNDNKTLQLKIIMCCALVVEEHAHSEKALKLYNSMESVLNRKLMVEPSSVETLPLLALLAGYHFLSNDEILAWRHIGQLARLCLELGIHQKTGLMRIQSEEERKNALVSFWTAYILDRRWAFGAGLPYVFQDDEIDPQLPLPDEHPFLVAMVTYSKLCAKVWRQVTHFGPILARELRHEEIERLDQEILQWYESVPEDVKVRNWNKERHITSTPSYNLQRLRIWTYLRLNQIRIWLYTPVLHSATSIMANPFQAQQAVDLAKDTIRYLNFLNTTTNLYRRIQVFYHQFLTSAISVVFLASVHAPVRFSAVCREEFYLALELVKDLSAKSWVSKRVWRTIRSLKDVAPRFGLNPDDDPHSTAALGMIGLARGHVDNGNTDTHPSYPRPSIPDNQAYPGSQVDQNGVLIQSEMSRIFEGYVGLNGVQPLAGEEERPANGSELPSPQSAGGPRGGADGTVFPQLREMY